MLVEKTLKFKSYICTRLVEVFLPRYEYNFEDCIHAPADHPLSQEYYDEKPILDLYTSVVTDVLLSFTSSKGKKGRKNDLWGFPWPRPTPKEPEGGMKRQKKATKALAKQVVKFERALIKAGADP
jgi:hypothetical protein